MWWNCRDKLNESMGLICTIVCIFLYMSKNHLYKRFFCFDCIFVYLVEILLLWVLLLGFLEFFFQIKILKKKLNLFLPKQRILKLKAGMPDKNFENQGFLIENQDFIRIFFFQKQEKTRSFFLKFRKYLSVR